MKRAIAILLGFLAFGLVGYVGGQAQSQQSEAIEQLERRLEVLERGQADRSDCACIHLEKGSRQIDVGGIHFYLVPVNGDTGKDRPK